MNPWKLLAATFKQNSHSRSSRSSQVDFALSQDELLGRESQVRAVPFLERDFSPPAEEVCIKHSAVLYSSRSCSRISRGTGMTEVQVQG